MSACRPTLLRFLGSSQFIQTKRGWSHKWDRYGYLRHHLHLITVWAVDVVVAPLFCSDNPLLSQKLSLQRVCENVVCTEHGILITGLGLVKIVYDENEAVSGSVRVSCRAQGNQRDSQHSSVVTCFFLSCKANARVKLAKTGHGPHSMLFGCYLCCSM
jgi:hypothetical protein